MKIVMLVPCLMLETNRKANHKALRYAKEHYAVDEIVICDQEFDEADYEEGYSYLFHKYTPRLGFVEARNALLKHFYKSDADFALWMDANGRVSKAALNDLNTLLSVAREGKLNVDAVFSTLGINISGERIEAKKMPDFSNNIYLVNMKSGYDWLHGMLMCNLKKKYGEEHYIDERCDPHKGTSEDVYFSRLLKRLHDCRLCPTITISKPSNRTSTWVADKTGYKYPPVDNPTVDAYIDEYIRVRELKPKAKSHSTIKYPRIEKYKEYIRPYKPKTKVKGSLIGKNRTVM